MATRTPLLTIANRIIAPDTLLTLPAAAAFPVPAVTTYKAVQLTVTLDLADKLAAEGSNTLDLLIYLSLNGTNVGGTERWSIHWTSYGPAGYTLVDRHGTTIAVNPDPTIYVPVTPFAGHGIYLTYILHGFNKAGLDIEGFLL